MRIYSTAKEHFLTPSELAAAATEDDVRIAAAWGDLIAYEDAPAVILVHVINDERHEERLYVNNDLILTDVHPRPEDHVCAERTGVLIARALDIPLDERRVAEADYAAKGHTMSLLAFSATTDWPRRGGYAK